MKNFFIHIIILFFLIICSCSEPIKEFNLDTDVQHVTLKLYKDSTFIEQVEELEDSYNYSGIWKGKLNEGDTFTTITTQSGLQIITQTPINNYKIKNKTAILIKGKETVDPILINPLIEDTALIIDTTWGDEEQQEPVFIINFDSLINTLPIILLKTFSINEFPQPNFQTSIKLDLELYKHIYGNKDGYDGPEYLIHKIKSSDSTLLFITYFSTAQGENIDGSPYIVNTIKLYNTSINGRLLQRFTLATEDINVITYKVSSFINSDTLIVNETYDQVLEDSDSDSLCLKTYKYLIPTKSNLFDTISINRMCE